MANYPLGSGKVLTVCSVLCAPGMQEAAAPPRLCFSRPLAPNGSCAAYEPLARTCSTVGCCGGDTELVFPRDTCSGSALPFGQGWFCCLP